MGHGAAATSAIGLDSTGLEARHPTPTRFVLQAVELSRRLGFVELAKARDQHIGRIGVLGPTTAVAGVTTSSPAMPRLFGDVIGDVVVGTASAGLVVVLVVVMVAVVVAVRTILTLPNLHHTQFS